MLYDGPAINFKRPKRPLKAAFCGNVSTINVDNPLCIQNSEWLRNVGGDSTQRFLLRDTIHKLRDKNRNYGIN